MSSSDLHALAHEPSLNDHPRYSMISHISRGRNGIVVLAKDNETGAKVAIKFVEIGGINLKYIEREIINQYKLRHPHIIQIVDVLIAQPFLALVLEYADMGDLHTYVMSRHGGIPEVEARWFFQQLILAVDFSHRMGVVNRDIKLENTLLSGETQTLVKIADFGFSKDENIQSEPTTRVGTIMYMSPEVVSSGPGHPYDAKKADVWSCGVVLYAMLTGKYPFKREEDSNLGKIPAIRATLRRILSGDYLPMKTTGASAECIDLLQKMLCQDAAQRMTIQDVMKHPWYLEGISPGVLQYNEALVHIALQKEHNDDERLKRIKSVLAELHTINSLNYTDF